MDFSQFSQLHTGSMPSEVRVSIDACIAHAQDLLKGAKALLAQRLPHLSYHLAALALEEVGKAGIIGMSHIADLKGERPPWMRKHSDDHVKKLFWAIWGPSFGQQAITKEQIESIQGLAKTIHEKRLQGLYVDIVEDSLCVPKDAISESEAKTIIGLAESRIGLESLCPPRELDSAAQSDLAWFISANEDLEKRKLILGKKSMEKLVELKQSYLWIKWLHEQFDQAEVASKSLLEKELGRAPGGNESKDKWKMRVRLQTNSHSVRPKQLSAWNQGIKWIKLYPVDKKKDELLVDILLPDTVPLDQLYWAGWGAFRRFVCALNIGSSGYFWWYVPKQIGSFAESVEDLENRASIKIERSPALKLDWGHGTMEEKDWQAVKLCCAMLPYPADKGEHEPFNHYLTALGFLSKTDVHMQFEANAFDEFYRALKSGMKTYAAWDGKEDFRAAFDKLVGEIMPSLPASERAKYFDMGEQFQAPRPQSIPAITLSEVGAMKIMCDAFFYRVCRDRGNARAEKENAADGSFGKSED